MKDVERAIDAARSAFYSWSKVCKVSDYSLSHDSKIMYAGQERKIKQKMYNYQAASNPSSPLLTSDRKICEFSYFLCF